MYSGYSWTTFDDLAIHVLQQIKPAKILDIGSGEGKWGRLIREHGLLDCHLTAVEYEPLRRDELLALGYNEVRSVGALDLMKNPAEQFDVVVLGDVIEHMRKSEGQDLLEYLNYRCAYMLVITPEAMPMSMPHFYEGHNSLWRPDSMRWHDLWAHSRNGVMHFYLLRGYLNNQAPSLQSLVDNANAQAFMQTKTSPNQTDVPRVLDMHNSVVSDPDATKPGVVWIYRHP